MSPVSPAASRRLVTLAQGVAVVALLGRLVAPPNPIASAASVALCAALLAVAAASAAMHARPPHRALCLTVAAACLTAFLSEIAKIVEIATGGPAGFLTPSRAIYLFGTHPAVLVGFGAALGLRSLRLRIEVALDALLLVAAAAIVQLLLPYGSHDLAALPTMAEKVAYVYRESVTAAELGLVALLVACRGESLGLRTAVATCVGTVAFAVANALRSHATVVPGATASASADALWLACVLVFTLALRIAPADDAGVASRAPGEPVTVRREDSGRRAALQQGRQVAILHGGAIVVAILICAASALVLGFSTQPRPALSIGVAAFGLLGAARIAYVLYAQRRETAVLASSVVAEREVSATLEARVAERTAELAEAQRVLQRMWVLGHQITLELRPARVLQRFVEAVMDVAQADGAVVGLLDAGGGAINVAAAAGTTAAMQGLVLPAEGSVVGRVARERRAWACEDVEADAQARQALHEPSRALHRAGGRAMRGFVAVPLQRRGETIGAISLVTSTPRRFTDGDLARIGSLTDILSVALANAELVENLRQAEWRFRTLFRAAPDAVLTVLQSGRVREANDCVRDLLGLDPVQVVGRQFADLVRPDDWLRLDAALRDALAGRPARLEVRCLRRTTFGVDDGITEERVVAIAASRLPEADPPTVLVVGRDITGEREMRARLLETERLAAVGELVAGVAHEVNNPLSSISAFAQLLLRDGGLSADQRESIEVIRAETMRASQVVRDLLAFARRSEPKRETLDLNVVVERTLRLRNYQLASSNVQVDLVLAPDLPPVIGDARQLQQVVLNLVTNSIQAMTPSGTGGTLRLTTRVAAGGAHGNSGGASRVELDVADTGPGIPQSARAHVFEPFFTTKPEGEGTGLGLSVSYGIVTAHGGTIQLAESTPRGTRFVVTLPVAAAASRVSHVGDAGDAADVGAAPGALGAAGGGGRPTAAAAAAVAVAAPSVPAAVAPPPPTRRSPLAGIRLLFIDDEPALRSGMEAFGRQRGFTVVTADEGGAGLAAVERTAFDAIVCDLRMPGMGGVAFHEALSRERPGLARRTVFITGDVVPGPGGTTATLAGRQPTVAKPFTFERLEEALVGVLKGS